MDSLAVFALTPFYEVVKVRRVALDHMSGRFLGCRRGVNLRGRRRMWFRSLGLWGHPSRYLSIDAYRVVRKKDMFDH